MNSHAWCYLYRLRRAEEAGSKQQIQNESMSPAGFEPATFRTGSWHLTPLGHTDR